MTMRSLCPGRAGSTWGWAVSALPKPMKRSRPACLQAPRGQEPAVRGLEGREHVPSLWCSPEQGACLHGLGCRPLHALFRPRAWSPKRLRYTKPWAQRPVFRLAEACSQSPQHLELLQTAPGSTNSDRTWQCLPAAALHQQFSLLWAGGLTRCCWAPGHGSQSHPGSPGWAWCPVCTGAARRALLPAPLQASAAGPHGSRLQRVSVMHGATLALPSVEGRFVVRCTCKLPSLAACSFQRRKAAAGEGPSCHHKDPVPL